LKRSLITRSASVANCGAFGFATRFVKAIHLLSGLKMGAPSTPRIWVTGSSSRSARRNQIDPPSSSDAAAPRRRPVNVRSCPSGLQRGPDALSDGSEIRRAGALPSAATIHNSDCRRFSTSTIAVLMNATQRPSGDIAGA
jgi:hypothetical protein